MKLMGVYEGISIHAPRTGSDVQHRDYMMHPRHFNPRSPHGERLDFPNASPSCNYFNPRSPHGERRSLLYCLLTLI